jgi:hypothetical protein
MSSWFPFNGMEQVAFKPHGDGFIYRAPSPWVFGRGQNYTVNVAQKAELAAKHRQMLLIAFWGIIAAAGVAGPLSASLAGKHALAALAVALMAGLAIGVGAKLWLVSKISPIVATLTPTDERITRTDTFKRQVAVMSPGFIVGYGVLSLALFALTVIDGLYGWNLYTILGAILFGVTTTYWAVLYVAKRRRSTQAAGGAC